MDDDQASLAQQFEEHRARLRGVAYRMLGSFSAADDAVQETWLRLARVDASEIENLPGLEGVYHLVQKTWSIVGNGTIPFFVRVEKGKLRHGCALTFIVKVREGLDL